MQITTGLDHARRDRSDGDRRHCHVRAEVISFERFHEQRENEIWKRVDNQEQKINEIKERVLVLETLQKQRQQLR